MRRTYARTLSACLVAVACVAPTRPQLSARNTDQPYGPYVPVFFASHVAAWQAVASRNAPLSEADRVAREIARTDRLITGAEGRVTRSGSDQARSDFRNARERQSEAKEARGQNFYARSNRLTLEARAYLKSALIQAGPPENDPEVVGRALDQTDDALERGKDIVEAAASSRQRLALKNLQERQEEARRLYKNGAMRGAYAETRDVRQGVVDLLRQCANLPVSRETARQALKRAERALTETHKEIGPKATPRAHQLERDAQEQLGRARVSFARAAYRDVLLHAKLVERHLQRAVEAKRLAANQTAD